MIQTIFAEIYIGKIKKNVEARFEEHLEEIESTEKEGAAVFKSKVAEHIVLNNHMVSRWNLRLVKHVRHTRNLDVTESLEIYRTPRDKGLNRDQGNGDSCY